MKYYSKAEQLLAVRNSIDADRIATPNFVVNQDSICKMTDKVGLIVHHSNPFYDHLPEFDGVELPHGKTVEEWYSGLPLVENFDREGKTTKKPRFPTYLKACYSFSYDEKVVPYTAPYNEYNRAVNSDAELADLVNDVSFGLNSAESLYKYNQKKILLGILAEKVIASETAPAFQTNKKYEQGDIVRKSGAGTESGVFINGVGADNVKDYDTLVKEGFIIKNKMLTDISAPIDTATGEAVIKQVKNDAEAAKFATQGYTLNGGITGAEEGLMFILKKGYKSTLDVDVLAGAFNQEKLALPATLKVIDDFGPDDNHVFGFLLDTRGVRLHRNCFYTMQEPNAEGGFVTYFRHVQYTGYLSRNTFVKVYRDKTNA